MAPFQFLHLPAELRNEIYERVLTHDRTKGITAAVPLLRTCRQIHREANGIFLAQSVFTVQANFSRTKPALHDCSFKYHLRTEVSGDLGYFRPDGVLSVVDYAQALPTKMLDSPTIKIQMALKDEVKFGPLPFKLCRTSSRFLYALVCLLSADDRNRKLEISANVSSTFVSVGTLIERIFWPLQVLGPQIELVVKGLNEDGNAALSRILNARITTARQMPNPVYEPAWMEDKLTALNENNWSPAQRSLLDLALLMLHQSTKLRQSDGLWEPSQDTDVRYSLAVARAILAFLLRTEASGWKADCQRALDAARDIALEARRQEDFVQVVNGQLAAVCHAVNWSYDSAPAS